MILYYNLPADELDEWREVSVEQVPPNIQDDLLGTYLNCDKEIPDGVKLCTANGTNLYTVISSKPIGKVGWSHMVKPIPTYPIPVKPLFKSKLVEELESIETEPTFDEQIEEDLELYGNAFYTTDEDGDKTRINPLTITTLRRNK